ncbi:MAG: membrane protein insertion efficiency factor YidD [Lachnospiraceae bacterium]|nr:membrane protein insertion efficiency factor YidD [Lachnospiraceae bacterium]
MIRNGKKRNQSFGEDDPRSINYNRILVVPKIKTTSLILYIIIPIILLFVYIISIFFEIEYWRYLLVVVCVYMSINVKNIVITVVQLYQVTMPKKIRNRCRFEPSCSQYMILSIEKYGVFKGIIKGIKRLRKCNNRGNGLNGGFDKP